MYLSVLVDVSCPYCSETISTTVDCSVPSQEYIEDCQVCCRPIIMTVEVDADGVPAVQVRDENA